MIEPGRSGHRNRAVAKDAARQVSTKKNGFRLAWILTHSKGREPAPPPGASDPVSCGGLWLASVLQGLPRHGPALGSVNSRAKELDGWKTGTSRAGTSTASPGLRLRPARALRRRILNVPKPRISMWSPRACASFTASRKASATSPQSPW